MAISALHNQLLQAAATGDAAQLAKLLDESRENPNRVKDDRGYPLLHITAKNAHLGAMRVLLTRQADPNLLNEEQLYNPFMPPHVWVQFPTTYEDESRCSNCFEAVKLLLSYNANPQHHLDYAVTSLDGGGEEMIRLLLSKGADPKARDRRGTPIIIKAASVGNFQAVLALLERGAEPFSSLLHDLAERFYSFWNSQQDEARLRVIRELVGRGININSRGGIGNCTPLHTAVKNNLDNAVIQLFLDLRADPRIVDSEGNTPLHKIGPGYYSTNGIANIDSLLKAGADVNAKNNQGQTPLHTNIGSRPEILSHLMARGADCNAKDKEENTPLHLISPDDAKYESKRTKATIRLLVERGADSQKNNRGQTPLEKAEEDTRIDGAQELIDSLKEVILEKIRALG